MATRAAAAATTRTLPLAGLRHSIYPGPVEKLSVSNFVPICEVKGLYMKARVPVQRSESSQRALDRGTAVHAKLDVDALPTRPITGEFAEQVSYADRLLDTARRWRLLASTGQAREINLYGRVHGIQLHGVADGFEDNATTLVENKTTLKMPPAEWKMRLALHQSLVYNHILRQMMDPSFDLVPFIHRPMPEGALARIVEVLDVDFDTILDRCQAALRALQQRPPQIERIHLRYSDREKTETYEFAVDLEAEEQLIASASEMWAGQREPVPLRSDGAFSCRFCEYKHVCLFVKRFASSGQRVV